MILSDLIFDTEMDVNCKYKVYECSKGSTTHHDAPLVYSSEDINKPLDSLLDERIQYITIINNTLIIEVVEKGEK